MSNVITVFTISFAFALMSAWLLGASYGEGQLALDIANTAGQYSIR